MSDIATGERHWLFAQRQNHTSTPIVSPVRRLLLPVIVVSVLCILRPITAGSSDQAQQQVSAFNSSVLSASIKIVRDIRQHHHRSNTSLNSVQQYEGHIYRCLAKITAHMELCVRQFNESFEEHYQWSSAVSSSEQSEEKVRRYCCMQNDFKDCWTRAIRGGCSAEEARPAKWLPLQMLADLRTDDRCKSYVLYPHKCRENIFSLWQILAFLLLMPFTAFGALLLTIVSCNADMASSYRSLRAARVIRANQEMEV